MSQQSDPPSALTRVFLAYPSHPAEIGQVIQSAIGKMGSNHRQVVPWPELDIAGRFVGTTVMEAIAQADIVAADISRLNFNVTYEIGYAVGAGKPVALVKSAALMEESPTALEVGVFDTVGYKTYENSDQLAAFLSVTAPRPLLGATTPNKRVPVYLLESKIRTDWAVRIVARIKKARLPFRTFDPNEQARLSGNEALRQVSQSLGVFLHLLPATHQDAPIHNQRAAFVAGLAKGLGRILVLAQSGDDPVPIDYRDLVTSFKHPAEIDDAVHDFASQVTEALTADAEIVVPQPDSALAKVAFGASTAENEMKELANYYLETDSFQRAVRGEVRIVVGRKGSGKTALFLRVRDETRANRENVVLDLKPEGYKLVKFKESVLNLLSIGTVEHTITAFWEYLLLLELCHKVLEKDHERHMRDHRLFAPYSKLAATYRTDNYVSEGDFAERVTTLLEQILQDFHSRYGATTPSSLSEPELTALLYRHNVADLRTSVVEYLRLKGSVWLLFDNVDKGWPAHGLKAEDMLIVRTLLDATRKVERHLHARGIDTHTLVFLRNDIYELLIDETPDRGKETRALLDWADPDLLRELIRRRIGSAFGADMPFDSLWKTICVSHIQGEETSQFLIERSLMRPRFLIDLLSHCRGYAINMRHEKIEQDDIKKGLATYSSDLLTDIHYEVRDVFPRAENALYAFIGSRPRLTAQDARSLLEEGGVPHADVDQVVNLLCWYGFFGLVRGLEEVTYLHSQAANYNMKLFEGIRRKIESSGTVEYEISPAFWPALSITPSG